MKILVIGHAPLPYEDLEKAYGPGTRTWQFARPLIDDGHEVTVLASRIPFVYPDDDGPTVSQENGCMVHRVSKDEFEFGGSTRRLIEELDPDCLIGATAFPSYVAAIYAGDRPLWADIFGSLLAEAQAKAALYYDDNLLDPFFRMNHALLQLADRFSTVSGRQAYELVGQLGAIGRLGAETFSYDFASSIPCGVEDIKLPSATDPTGGAMKEGDFLVLWSGGFNTWTDVETLFKGMEIAMERSPRVRFVSTGGMIKGHDEKTYPRFQSMVASSRHSDRFHLRGWVPRSEAQSYYGTVSVGINIDARHYEVMFGSRNRILEWALSGLPAVSTNLCELTAELAREGLLFPVAVGDPESLAASVLELEADRSRLKDAGSRIKGFVLEKYSFGETTRPLREWAKAPVHAPDFDRIKKMRYEVLESSIKATQDKEADPAPGTRVEPPVEKERMLPLVKRSLSGLKKKVYRS